MEVVRVHRAEMTSSSADRQRGDDPARHPALHRQGLDRAAAARSARERSRPRGRSPRRRRRRLALQLRRRAPSCSRSRLAIRLATTCECVLQTGCRAPPRRRRAASRSSSAPRSSRRRPPVQPARLCPARRADAITCRASGSWSANCAAAPCELRLQVRADCERERDAENAEERGADGHAQARASARRCR